ncbi:DUF2735 domain-containing protein [Rhizobium sp. Root482]|jgi:hypothetical protein|uniref:DUF2735 domain-containing protein n=1 Tax=Rhizobium sp. Root482 TaxID=1736543 RepID=UPI0006F5C161|nr:DUF2735 domain-containing protein [Rhizobium sp. Root482]KQY26304.1 hypothetical protein ASD31_20110 [Rhizobium sp. Root482]
MTVISASETAKIYEFPSGGRRTGRRYDQPGVLAELRPQAGPVLDYENWYHQDAMGEAEQTPKS